MSDAKTLRLSTSPSIKSHAFLPQAHSCPTLQIGNLGLAGAKQPSQSALGLPQPGLLRAKGRRAGVRGQKGRRGSREARNEAQNGYDRGQKVGGGAYSVPCRPSRVAGPGNSTRTRQDSPASLQSLLRASEPGSHGNGDSTEAARGQAGPRFQTLEGLGGGSTREDRGAPQPRPSPPPRPHPPPRQTASLTPDQLAKLNTESQDALFPEGSCLLSPLGLPFAIFSLYLI